MTLNEAIEYADDIKPNAFSDGTKTAWINEVEGLVQTEVMLIDTDDIIRYSFKNDADTVLLVKPPHEKIYYTYLAAMIDFGNGEYNRYQNTMELFNSFFTEYMRWYASKYRPADGGAITHGYYISAYGIAVNHGYTGTEEQWIQSLKGEAATVQVGTVTTGAAGSDASVTNSGTGSAAVFDFVIPKGDKGDPGTPGLPGADGSDGAPGAPGIAATVTVGTVTTGAAGTNASVTNSGTANAAILDFVIPRGNTGQSGSGTGDMLASVYDTHGKAQDIFDYVDNATPDVSAQISAHNSSGTAHSDIRTLISGKETAGAAAALANRTTAANAADTNYTTLMFRGESLHSTPTTPSVNGAICWTYE